MSIQNIGFIAAATLLASLGSVAHAQEDDAPEAVSPIVIQQQDTALEEIAEAAEEAAEAAEEAAEEAANAADDVVDEGPRRGPYMAFLWREIEYAGRLDIYGVSAQLPEGWLKVKWDYGWLRADNRFDRYGNRGPVINPLVFDSPTTGERLVDVDLNVGGSGHGHTFQVSYGIRDYLNFYTEIPFTAMNLRLNPSVNVVDDHGNRINPAIGRAVGVTDPQNYNEEQFLYETFPALGRPSPAVGYDGNWLLGDINMGFSWNYHRNSRYSGAWTNRVFLPTGHTPAPEVNITYATGPQPEMGVGGWGVSTTNGYDFRLYKHSHWVDVILSTEIGFGYFFKQNRPYPSNFVPPQDPDTLNGLGLGAMFPDLSNLSGTFEYTPGFNTSWNAQLTVNVIGLNLAVGYGWDYSQKPIMRADDGFISMVDSLELLGAQARNQLMIGGSIPLIPLGIPANIGIVRRIMLDGRDTLAFSNFWQVTVETLIPLSMIWDRERRHRTPDGYTSYQD